MITALMGAGVVFVFHNSIDRMWVLAVVMPIIAGMGGNAGTQALAVTIRRIAVGLIPPGRGIRVVGKELLVGMVNGIAVGFVAGLAASQLGYGWELGAVVTVAMWATLTLATTAGALIPLVLQKLGADPAVASSVFVTAMTDIVGFFLLLGLAAAFLLPRI
jgi:magnesium transporter